MNPSNSISARSQYLSWHGGEQIPQDRSLILERSSGFTTLKASIRDLNSVDGQVFSNISSVEGSINRYQIRGVGVDSISESDLKAVDAVFWIDGILEDDEIIGGKKTVLDDSGVQEKSYTYEFILNENLGQQEMNLF